MLNGNDEICVLGNNFIHYRKDMTRLSSQLFYLALSKINPHIPTAKEYNVEFPYIEIPWREVLNAFGMDDKKNSTGNIERVAKYTRLLQAATIRPPKSKSNYHELNIFSSIEFSREENFKVYFNPMMKPYLLELSDKLFTNILFSDICFLRSKHSIRLLEVITKFAYQNKGKKNIRFSITVDNFKKMMYIEKLKSGYNTINRDVIKESVKEINDLGNYKITYEGRKEGRSVVELIFYVELPEAVYKFTTNKAIQAPASEQTAKVSEHPTPQHTPQQQAFVDMLSADEKLSDDILADRLSKSGYAEANTRKQLELNRDKFLWAVAKTDEAVKKGKVKSYGAYLATMLKQDVSFDNAVAMAQADEVRRAENERINAQRLAESDARNKKEQEERSDITKKNVKELTDSISFYTNVLNDQRLSKASKDRAQKNLNMIFNELKRRGIEYVDNTTENKNTNNQKEQASKATTHDDYDYSDVPAPEDDDYDFVESEDYNFNDVEDMPTPEDYFRS